MNVGRMLAFPFGIGSDGRALCAGTLDAQVLQELEQLVLTNPGERAFLPTFGGGASGLLFEAADANTALVAKATLTSAIQNWLAGRAALMGVDVTASSSTIRITITYQVAGAPPAQAVFQRSAP